MAELLHDKVRKNLNLISQTIDMQFQYLVENDVVPNLKLVEEIAAIEQNIINHSNIMNKITANNEEPKSEDIENFYNKEISKGKFDATKTTMYKDMQNLIKNLTDGNRNTNDPGTEVVDDMSIVDTQSYIDPITKNRLVNPVRNLICNHVYERDSLEQSLKINPRLRCPVMGCGNKNFVLMSQVRDDYELKNKLMALQMTEEDSD